MKIVKLALALVAVFAVSGTAQAKHHKHRHHSAPTTYTQVDPGCNVIFPCAGVIAHPRGVEIAKKIGIGEAKQVYEHRAGRGQRTELYAPQREATVVSHPEGCPRVAFCGCGTAVRLLGAPIRSLWLAANWFKFPQTAPAPNMAAVRSHHVFALIEHRHGNVWLAYNPNSGRHLTRIMEVDISRYTIVNPHGGTKWARL